MQRLAPARATARAFADRWAVPQQVIAACAARDRHPHSACVGIELSEVRLQFLHTLSLVLTWMVGSCVRVHVRVRLCLRARVFFRLTFPMLRHFNTPVHVRVRVLVRVLLRVLLRVYVRGCFIKRVPVRARA
jgi:hypothetical protein